MAETLPVKVCSLERCRRKAIARGWCTKHYQRWKSTGDPVAVKNPAKSEAERFWPKVAVGEAGECWLWLARKLPRGYGQFGVTRDGQWQTAYAHRWSYEDHHGSIPKGMSVHHTCNNPSCVNPRHLQAMNLKANNMLGGSPPAANARKTHCVNGHEFVPENTYVWKDGSRTCRVCGRERKRKVAAA